jgi:hypothetical protein
MRQIINRLDKVENSLVPKKMNYPCIVTVFATKKGLNGKVIRNETDEEAIQKHLVNHPEDKGREFEIILLVAVSCKPAGLENSNV